MYQKLRTLYYIKWNFLWQITAASRTPDYELPPPDPRSLCPLSSAEFVEHPRTKFLGTPLAPEEWISHLHRGGDVRSCIRGLHWKMYLSHTGLLFTHNARFALSAIWQFICSFVFLSLRNGTGILRQLVIMQVFQNYFPYFCLWGREVYRRVRIACCMSQTKYYYNIKKNRNDDKRETSEL